MPESVESLAFWADGIEPAERCRRMVKSQQIVSKMGIEGSRRDRDIDNIRLYENSDTLTLYAYAGEYYSQGGTTRLPPDQSKNNRAKAAIDTLASQISSTDVRARFKVVDGNYRQRRRARELQNFSDGLVHELKLHKLKQRAFLDSCILDSGVGAIQFYEQDGRCAAQRVLATELSWDPEDGLVDGMPRTIYRRRPMPRDQVVTLFGDTEAKKAAITGAKTVHTYGAPSDRIDVYEAWHLPSSKKAKDGWHLVGLEHEGGDLVADQYKKPHHEIVFLVVEERFTTGWGLSLMTQAASLQREINANTYRADRITKLYSAGHLYVNKVAMVEKSKLSNEIGSVWEGNLPAGEAMSVIQFNGMTRDIDEKIERAGQRIFENLGISVTASQGETNAGLNASAASKREDTAKSDKRNSVRQQRWEQFHLDCDRAALSVVRDIVGSGKGGYKVAVPGKRGLTRVDWQEVAMDEDDYVREVRPASPIPTEPAGLVAYGEHMLEIGEWQPGELSAYMQDLDADGRVNRKKAQERNYEKLFEKLLYDKVAVAIPDEFTKYDLAIEIGTEYLAQGEEDGVPEKNLERVRRYLKRCKKLASAAQAAAAPPPQAAPVGQPVTPGATSGPPQLQAV